MSHSWPRKVYTGAEVRFRAPGILTGAPGAYHDS
jgi:hypothetical protein